MRLHGLLTIKVLLFALSGSLFGCAQPRSSQEVLVAMAPLDLLREVGRTICDAETVEIRERIRMTPHTESSFKGGSRRILFGPNGEYRFETPEKTIVHDGRHAAWWIPWNRLGGPKYEVPAVQTRDYQPRAGPHSRYPGDLVMAAGMGQGCDRYLPYLRLCGADWLKQTSLGPVLGSTLEKCSDHACRKISVVCNNDETAEFWVDLSRTVFHKIVIRSNDGAELAVYYDTVKFDTRLSKDAFEIPREVFDRAGILGETCD